MIKAIEKFKKQFDEFNDKKKQLVEELRLEFPKIILELLEKSDFIETISWKQYTPYFNDGEAPVFSTSHDSLLVNGYDEYDDEYDRLLPYHAKILQTDEDVIISDEFAVKYDETSFIGRKKGMYGLVPNPNYDKKNGDLLFEIKNTLMLIPDEFYLELFGDHTEVKIYKDGRIETSEYEHD